MIGEVTDEMIGEVADEVTDEVTGVENVGVSLVCDVGRPAIGELDERSDRRPGQHVRLELAHVVQYCIGGEGLAQQQQQLQHNDASHRQQLA